MGRIARWVGTGIVITALLCGGVWHAQAQDTDTIVLPGTIRDFNASHPDFEAATGSRRIERGIVEQQLGSDLKPVYAGGNGTRTTTGQTNYDQWYRDTPEVNLSMPFSLTLVHTGTEEPVFLFLQENFFPIDNQLFGNEGRNHNFHFTLELHAQFTYNGGEFVTIQSDDDAWLFINGMLAIDLGGAHPRMTKTVSLDEVAEALALTPGEKYDFDLFFAERNTPRSVLIIETSLELMPGRGCTVNGTFVVPCVGTDGDDMIAGTSEDDVIDCGGGNDMVDAGDGNDVVNCGDGNDTIVSGPGNDVVNAGDGDDDVEGGEGDDVLNGDDGDDLLVGNAGNDCLNGDEGDDVTIADDNVTIADDSNADDNVPIAVSGLPVFARVRRINNCPTGFSPLPRGEDVHSGGGGNDLLCGSNGRDTMFGGRGDDTLFGFGRGDALFGNRDNDTIDGGGNQNDSCNGGAGRNTVRRCGADFGSL